MTGDVLRKPLSPVSVTIGGQPAEVRNPHTQETFILVRRDAYEKMRRLIDGMTRSAGWDDPALDDYEQFRNP